MLRKFVIEREIPGIGSKRPEEYCAIAQQSKNVLDGLGTGIQWLESYVAQDKTYCVYLAADASLIREHAARSGFPADRIVEIRTTIDPTLAPA
ncbi:MAG: DUF4242 domain-containing protein [Pseudomonadota bacterium]|jgi:hypothetical protein|nr:MAG: DUF4242 domain-containing protein [Pseudomonadota bacterium]